MLLSPRQRAVGAFSDQLHPFSPLPTLRQLPLLPAEVEDRDGRNGETFDSNVADDVWAGTEDTTSLSTRIVRNRWGGFVIVGNKSRR